MATYHISIADARASSPVPSRLHVNDAAYALLLLPPFLWSCLFLVVRPLGAPALAVALAPLMLVATQAGRRYLAKPLILYAIITAVYGALSYLGVLDQHLTLLFDRNAVIQQCAYGLCLVFAVASFAVYHQGVAEGRPWFLRLEELVFLLSLLSRLTAVFTGDAGDGSIANFETIAPGLSQYVNGETFLAFIFVRRLIQSPRYSQPINIFVAFCLVLTAGSAQSRISLLPLLALVVAPSLRRAITVWYIFALIAVIIVAWPFADQIWVIDPNTGIRLFFWQDAIQRFFESYGVGVGFGTETIRPVYDLRVTDVTLLPIDDPAFIMIGSHNAFVDALYRMGVLGIGCFVYYIANLFKSVLRLPSVGIFDCWVVCLMFTVLAVNVGLVSFNFFFGSTFLLGWLTYRTSRLQV